MKLADAQIPAPEKNINDPFNLLQALCGLIVATQKPLSQRLSEVTAIMEKALHVKLNWHNASIETADDSLLAYEKIRQLWNANTKQKCDILLHRWLAMELSSAFFPFAGLGKTLAERITLIGVRMATFQLALMCAHAINEKNLQEETAVKTAQVLSRFLSHLADATFSLQIYTEAGWTREARLCGLLGV